MRKLLCLSLFFTTLFSIVGCKKEEKEPTVTPENETCRIIISDIDGEVLGDKLVSVDRDIQLYQALEKNFDVVGGYGDYGAYLTSINGSIIDDAWSLMIYKNGQEVNNSADKIEMNKDDIFEIKNVCWKAIDYGYGTSYDETDVMLDKTIYSYLKNINKTISELKDFKGTSYWDFLLIDTYQRFGYYMDLIDLKFSQEFLSSLNHADFTSFYDADFGKYYIASKIAKVENPSFITAYNNYLSTITAPYNQWSHPFSTLPAAHLRISNDTIKAISTEDITGTLEWGPDGNMWQLAGQGLFSDRTNAISNIKDYCVDNTTNTSNGLTLLGFSSIGFNIRDKEKFGTIQMNNKECDYLEMMFEKYYDKENYLMKVNTSDTSYVTSSNQLYCGLLAYKILRDKGFNTKVNIFGPIFEE